MLPKQAPVHREVSPDVPHHIVNIVEDVPNPLSQSLRSGAPPPPFLCKRWERLRRSLLKSLQNFSPHVCVRFLEENNSNERKTFSANAKYFLRESELQTRLISKGGGSCVGVSPSRFNSFNGREMHIVEYCIL